MGKAGWNGGKVGSVLTQSIPSTLLFLHWGPRPTDRARPLGLYKSIGELGPTSHGVEGEQARCPDYRTARWCKRFNWKSFSFSSFIYLIWLSTLPSSYIQWSLKNCGVFVVLWTWLFACRGFVTILGNFIGEMQFNCELHTYCLLEESLNNVGQTSFRLSTWMLLRRHFRLCLFLFSTILSFIKAIIENYSPWDDCSLSKQAAWSIFDILDLANKLSTSCIHLPNCPVVKW